MTGILKCDVAPNHGKFICIRLTKMTSYITRIDCCVAVLFFFFFNSLP